MPKFEEDQEKLRTILETSVNAMVTIDEQGRIEFFNSSAEALLGYAREEVIGKNVALLMPEPYRSEHDGYLSRYRDTSEARIIGIGRAVAARRKNGTSFPVDLSVSEALVNGQRFFTGVLRDLTERQRAEEELRRFERIVSATPDLVALFDRSYRYQLVNDSYLRTFGKKRQEILGQTSAALLGTETFEQTIRPNLDRALAGEHVDYESWFDMGPQGRQYQAVTYRPYRDAEGTITGVVSDARDFTERKRAEEEKALLEAQLRHAQRLETVGTLAGGVAHDFNNILMAIFACTEMALSRLKPDSQEVRKYLEDLLEAAERAKQLVHQILTFSRRGEQKREPVRIQEIVNDAMKLMRATLPSTVVIDAQIDRRCETVLADSSQIHQVVMNLCTNAALAMTEESGQLKVRLDRIDPTEHTPQAATMPVGPCVRLTIGDSGRGMGPDTLERIFEPFFTTREAQQGTGLGLSVVHGIVTSHGGTITVDSEPGSGSTFQIDLPRHGGETAAEPRRDRQIVGGIGRILYVDDEKRLAHLGQKMLTPLGYTVTVATDGVEALELFRTHPEAFDLVITDQTMPGITGTQLASRLLSIRPDLPVVLITGYGMMQKEACIREVLLKPFKYVDLSEVVRRVLGR
jgi:PAS domain S-box-containing protein